MLFHILKKDLQKRKGVNVILFLFITLATVFLSSSVNNILVVNNSIDYFMEYAHVPDVMILTTNAQEKSRLDAFMETSKQDGVIREYGYERLVPIAEHFVYLEKGNYREQLNSEGISIFLGTTGFDFVKVFDENGDPFRLHQGEIALPLSFMDKHDLHIGDAISINVNGESKRFVITVKMKDAAFGNDFGGMQRMILSSKEFDAIADTMDCLGLYSVRTDQKQLFQETVEEQNFLSIMHVVTDDMYRMMYSFDMMIAGLLISIGCCLILISMLVLRFTLVFTMEEQYQEIGILKAIGLRDLAIKKIYLIKYLVIVTTGAILGMLLGLPVSGFMIRSVSRNMILESSNTRIGVHIGCALFIILLVFGFCYFCTKKLNRISAVHAIRVGHSGERFQKLRGFRLHRCRHLPVSTYLGMNDILSHSSRYIVLVITFCISFILITIPVNTLNTMKSEEMFRKFMLDPQSAVYVRALEKNKGGSYTESQRLEEDVEELRMELKEKGYDTRLSVVEMYFISFSDQKDGVGKKIMTAQVAGEHGDMEYLDFDEGIAPELENEIAVSKNVLSENGWVIGDSIYGRINGVERKFLITASYTDYMQLGNSVRLNAKLDMYEETLFGYWAVMVDMETDLSQEELAERMNREFPDYEWLSGQTLLDRNIGDVQSYLKELLFPMTAMLCAVIMLITLLMERLFITREKGEIAMMKSCGFTYHAICRWQLIRMTCVVAAAMMISIPLSFLSNTFILCPIFAILGADIVIQLDWPQVFLIYPAILLAGILLATRVAARSIRHIDIHEMNNLE